MIVEDMRRWAAVESHCPLAWKENRLVTNLQAREQVVQLTSLGDQYDGVSFSVCEVSVR